MSKELQTSVSDQVGERMASGGCSDFHIRHWRVHGILRILCSAHMSNASMAGKQYLQLACRIQFTDGNSSSFLC